MRTSDTQAPRSRRPIAWLVASAALLATLAGPAPADAAKHELGLGMRYWAALDDLDDEGFPDDFDDSGLAWVGSYLFDVEGLLKFAVELEYAREGFGGSTSSAWTPQALVLIGGGLYGGVGIAMTQSSSLPGNRSDPFFIGRIGLDLPLLPRLSLDLNLNWQADAFNKIDHLDSDALTLGAIVRYRFNSGKN
jgi:hypothetical protein